MRTKSDHSTRTAPQQDMVKMKLKARERRAKAGQDTQAQSLFNGALCVSTHMVDSREKIAKLNWPMVRMAVPGTQGEWSAQSLLQSFIRACLKESLC